MTAAVPFRFDAAAHEYIDLQTGAVLPHITGMLQAAGVVDDTWFTEESSARGTAVHALTAEYDLGALDVEGCASRHRGYLLAHVAAMKIIRPEILAVEEPRVHPVKKFGGRPDRELLIRGLLAVLEVKAAAESEAHAIQTALQAILVAPGTELEPWMISRFCLYLKPTGKFKLVEHTRRQDFAEAERVIRRCCR